MFFKKYNRPHKIWQPIVKIKQFCMARGIPFYMTFATANDDTETEYLTSKQLPPECDVELFDDKFRKIVLAEHGFDLLINHVDSFDMADICDGLMSQPTPVGVDEDDY